MTESPSRTSSPPMAAATLPPATTPLQLKKMRSTLIWSRAGMILHHALSYLDDQNNADHTLEESESHDSTPTPPSVFPSHARRQKPKAKARLGGPKGPNTRAFMDEVVMFTRRRAPLIGVKSWKDFKQNVKDSIVYDVLNISIRNSMNRQQQKTMHLSGSKPFSQLSYEQENTCSKLNERGSDTDTQGLQDNHVFQSTYKETGGCKSSKLHGLGYLAKPQTRTAQKLNWNNKLVIP
ncbi:hypothetical protein C2845_PM03G22440 [Panicum miliaceum]|uniref:Uncharacterized protein n=1 Tax=Panicum miliaceum TaxID=4540 RepID=A0A3L6TDM1_PANMI|nr:hypothetical protein C2845_PM03G22440 [Panicum miliaceum]